MQEFYHQYAARAGVESPHEQAIRRGGLRRCRSIGHAKAHLQPLITAAAINLVRVEAWLAWHTTSPDALLALCCSGTSGESDLIDGDSENCKMHSPPVSSLVLGLLGEDRIH